MTKRFRGSIFFVRALNEFGQMENFEGDQWAARTNVDEPNSN
jgi:hypothetical protein